ncbi:hypothetical protein KKF83_01245 [Patescibacteria group bacterium]|nr:hypothetical protein [Patescibacteria group bacterium]
MPKAVFVIDKMAHEKIVPVQVSEKDWQKGIFDVRINGKTVTAQRPEFSNPGKGVYATHVAFWRKHEAHTYKTQTRDD